jgi:hypothetical protein
MCNIGILRGPEEIILDPDYRRPDLIAPDVQVFRYGGGDLRNPVTMTQGNGLTVELMDSNGRVVQSASRSPGSPQLQVGAADLPAGIYSLRFSGYGNGTKIRVDAPTGP